MKNHALTRIAFLVLLCLFASITKAQTLVWSEEFTASSLDNGTWTYDFGNGCHEGVCDWGNSELQYYTSRADNVFTSGGILNILAKSETFGTKSFTSGRINTEGRVHFKYGTLEARIQIPNLQNGLWPAFWLMGATGGTWPAVGEIDIAEWGIASAIAANVVNRRVGGACHWDYQGSYAGYGTHTDFPTNLNTGYHIYKVVWTPQMIKCYVDNVEYYALDISNPVGNSMEEFHNMKYILLNLAVGGTYTGITSTGGITAPLPATMKVDYIRLYQDSNGELWLGEDEAECGDYGVFTENTPVSDKLVYGTEANLYTWNGLSAGSRAAYEGSQVMSYNTSAGVWYGLGVNIEGRKNMSSFSGGSLKFRIKTNSPNAMRVGISTGHGESWVTLSSSHGYLANNTWRQITVPFSAFYDLDLGAVKQMFMITGDVPTSSFNLDIDDVYYSGGGTCTSTTGDGLSATYYNNSNFTSQVLTRVDPTINFSWGSGSPASSIGANTFSTRWTGSVKSAVSGTHTFYTRTDDGVRLWVNGQQLVNKWVNQGPTEWSGTINLTAGQAVPIVMEYYENTGGATAQLSWAGPGISKQIIPQANLYSTTVTAPTSIHIEAEDYTAMLGIQTQPTTDAGLGLNVGYTDAGDWMDYSVAIPTAGTYTISYRVASVPGGTVQFRRGTSTLATTNIAATGGWQNWTTITTNVTLPAGAQTIRLYVSVGGWNINWLKISGGTTSRFAASEGVEALEPPSLKYSPNPFGQKGLFVQVPEDMEQLTSIRVVDMLGRKIMEKAEIQPGEELFILQNVQTGLYLIQWLDQSNQVLQTAKVLRE